MASNGTLGLLPGQSAPLATITSTNQGGIVVIAASLGLAFALISILIRVYMQLQFRLNISPDDFLAIASLLFSAFQASAVYIAVSKGFGKTISDISGPHLVQLQTATYASELLYIITIWLTKCSVALLFIRLSPNRLHNLAAYTILAASTLFTFISVLIVALRCDLSQPWIFVDAQCPSVFARWQIVACFDIVTELALFFNSVYMVKSLQLSIQKKSVVVLAFGLRLPTIILAVLRLDAIRTVLHSTDQPLKGAIVAVYTQIEISYAIIAATTPCLRPFMKALSTNYGAPASIKSSPHATKAYSMNNLSKRSGTNGTQSSNTGTQLNVVNSKPALRWDKSEHKANVIAGDRDSISSHDSKQMIISKNTEWAVAYEQEPRRGS